MDSSFGRIANLGATASAAARTSDEIFDRLGGLPED
jgi:hypothetical protein